MAASSSTKIFAKYAKSGRSACKKCWGNISASAHRLGLVSRDTRGFNMTKWHHLSSCPIDSQSIAFAEKINGFPLLKASDQETLKLLLVDCDQSQNKDSNGENDETETSNKDKVKESKVRKFMYESVFIFQMPSNLFLSTNRSVKQVTVHSKKLRHTIQRNQRIGQPVESGKEAKLEITFSISDVKDNYKGATLLPEWKAFQTIIFLERGWSGCLVPLIFIYNREVERLV
ncbi:hypothetical protein Sjap_021038 [Stephania japonica]|uniref:PARP-type domain-containing protein n=1 Tax=Stephania japonica TaxID=461633 RepID=A0AAP0I156_9MAGN